MTFTHITLYSLVIITSTFICRGRDNAVGIVTAYRLDSRGVRVRVPVGARFSHLHAIQTDSGAHPASYPMGTRDSFPGGKVAGA
jgi:hypothetical protein